MFWLVCFLICFFFDEVFFEVFLCFESLFFVDFNCFFEEVEVLKDSLVFFILYIDFLVFTFVLYFIVFFFG